MYKKHFGIAILIFILWSAIDFLICGILLKESYIQTSTLWRPKEEMKLGLYQFVLAIQSLVFVFLYTSLTSGKKRTLRTAMNYAVLAGVGSGLSMGYASYSFMPIPSIMAFSWFAGTLIACSLGGVILGCFFQSAKE